MLEFDIWWSKKKELLELGLHKNAAFDFVCRLLFDVPTILVKISWEARKKLSSRYHSYFSDSGKPPNFRLPRPLSSPKKCWFVSRKDRSKVPQSKVLQKWKTFFIIQHCTGWRGGSEEKKRGNLRSVPTILAWIVGSLSKIHVLVYAIRYNTLHCFQLQFNTIW